MTRSVRNEKNYKQPQSSCRFSVEYNFTHCSTEHQRQERIETAESQTCCTIRRQAVEGYFAPTSSLSPIPALRASRVSSWRFVFLSRSPFPPPFFWCFSYVLCACGRDRLRLFFFSVLRLLFSPASSLRHEERAKRKNEEENTRGTPISYKIASAFWCSSRIGYTRKEPGDYERCDE